MVDLTEGKVTNAFYLIDEVQYEKPKGIQSLDQDEVYMTFYDKESKTNVARWVKTSEILSFRNLQ